MKIADSITRTNETELVERLRSGDNAAMEELYNAYSTKLYALIFEQVGGNPAVAEDMVQEVLFAVLKSADRFRGDSQLSTWLHSIAQHKISDFHRRQARESKSRELHFHTNALEPEQIGDAQPSASAVMESEETRHTVHQALIGLPVDYRRVLVFKYIDEMPVQQISKVMRRSPKSVEGLLSRARKAMRANLMEAAKSK